MMHGTWIDNRGGWCPNWFDAVQEQYRSRTIAETSRVCLDLFLVLLLSMRNDVDQVLVVQISSNIWRKSCKHLFHLFGREPVRLSCQHVCHKILLQGPLPFGIKDFESV